MISITVAGVPEHFNYPWHMAIKEGAFQDRGLDVQWKDVPEGTGRMCEMLRTGETDFAIILTEGIIKDIAAGNPSGIVQVYVKTPLIWGIHVAANSPYRSLDSLKGTVAAISRYGSGSHLMSFVNANRMGWNTRNLKFKVVNTLEGGVEALSKEEAAYFLWEHYTTKPLVDEGTFRRLGDCPTPWPCFVIAVRNTFVEEKAPIVKHVLEVINTYTADFKHIPGIAKTLANKYRQQPEDVTDWLSRTSWGDQNLTPEELKKVQSYLLDLDLLSKLWESHNYITEL
ncbi:substrate-binding domain-containing protein [Ascidiimonas aurantiaca]|uniref:substrate-binding domain-containing protein n=1 Tax=Ascidiimonas aurantiaca TaxID=1685432 RepID=UPI0030EC2990